MISEISEFFLKRPINVTQDSRLNKRIVLRGFLGATIYSILYGIYEYFEVYNGIALINTLGSTFNWTIMWSGLIIATRFSIKNIIIGLIYMSVLVITIAVVTHFSIPNIIMGLIFIAIIISTVAIVIRFSTQNIIMGLFYMSVLEDFVFWLCKWGSSGIYPFPAADWWDSMFATYRVLGNWGQAINFWPYVPFYYLPSIAMLCIYYITAYKKAICGRYAAWLIGPIFLVIVGAAFLDDFTATLCLIFVPFALLAYVFALALYSSYKSEKKPENS